MSIANVEYERLILFLNRNQKNDFKIENKFAFFLILLLKCVHSYY